MDAPRVIMVISDFFPIVGGGERQAQHLAARLVARGVDVRVITHRYPGLFAFERVDDVPVYRVPTQGRGPLAALTYARGVTPVGPAWLAWSSRMTSGLALACEF